MDADQLLDCIQKNGGPEGLDLSQSSLGGIDLSEAVVRAALGEWNKGHNSEPHWITRLDGNPRLNLRRINLAGSNLTAAKLQCADLYEAQLEGANLGRARLNGAQLEWAQLENATLIGACLCGANLIRANLEGAEMGSAQLSRAKWHGAFLQRTRLTRRQLEPAIQEEANARLSGKAGAYQNAAETYLLHKNNFISLGRYDDASWAYLKEKRMERVALRKEGRCIKWLGSWFFDLAAGYGERPWKPVAMGAVGVLLFGVGYAVSGTLPLADALVYSFATFATLSLARPALQPQGIGVEIVSSVEALFGIGVLALVVYTLGNRMSRS